ncbi:MAG: PUA domain-containing protein [Methanomassiliicoccus sp.]|nr:PUA domain-containing protein [Methanomassiliicoccus sp.]
MSEIRIRKRHRLREKEIKALDEEIKARLGVEVFLPGEAVDRGESSEYDVLFIGNQVQGIVYQGKAFLTVRGLLKHPATKAFVTVDMGAVPYVTKGADVMGPGIVDADPSIMPGDLVWVKDIKNGRPLMIGEALISGEQMGTKSPGKAIKSIHFVADKLWKVDEDS